MTRQTKVVLGIVGVVLFAGHFLCSKTIPLGIFESPGYGTFQIEVSGLGYFGRCDLTYDGERDRPALHDCVGDRLRGELRLDGLVTGIRIPCTVLFPRMRFIDSGKVVFDDYVTTKCSFGG